LSPSEILSRLCALLLVAAALPAAAQRDYCPEERERAAAVRERIEHDWPLRRTDSVTRYLQDFGRRLANRAGIGRVSNWRFFVVQNTSINAYSIGDGLIYITEGAISKSADEDELAAILAHEMGHDIAGHFCPRAQNNGDKSPWWDIFSSPPSHSSMHRGTESYYGSLRQVIDPIKENEADRNARVILRKAGYDPRAMARIARRVSRGTNSGRPSHLRYLPAGESQWIYQDEPERPEFRRNSQLQTIQQRLHNDHS
jgi:predicted Zn-dependent protease